MSQPSDEEIRRWARPEDVQAIAGWVHDGRCQCCGYYEDLQALPCGHLRCDLCEHRDHSCMACGLAM